METRAGMNILFTICGRAGSKGIKNKNIRNFVGKPLPYYTLSAVDLFLRKTALEIQADCVANSDSKELLELMKENPFMKVYCIERRKELAGDAVGKIEVIRDCLNRMEANRNCEYDIVIDLDITSPLRTADDIERLIVRHKTARADVTTSVVPARRNPYFNQVKKTEHGYKKVIASSYTARQQTPEIFDMNASLYAYYPHYLKSGKGVLDGYCECIEMYDTGILDLDHENDFELMEVLARYLFTKKDEFQQIYENISNKEFDRGRTVK